MLLNVPRIKKEKIYEKCVKNKNMYNSIIGDQDLLNDIAIDKVGYLPFNFGICSPYRNDEESDFLLSENPYNYQYHVYNKINYSSLYKNTIKFIQLAYNPFIIHQYNGKWMLGRGMTIYRRLAQYYIKLAGIWDETCIKYPGYCKK